MRKLIKAALLVSSAIGLFCIASTAQASKASSYNVKQISKHIKKGSDTFSGATTTNGVLTFVVKNSAAYSGVGEGKAGQKVFSNDVQNALYKYRDNPLTQNGILVTGACIKLDDGSKKPLFVAYYDKVTIDTTVAEDYSRPMENFKHPLRVVNDADAYFVYKHFLDYNDVTGIFKNVDPYNTDNAPEWFRPIVQGTTVPKPVK